MGNSSKSHSASSSSSRELQVELLLTELLMLPAAQRAAALQAMCLQHPEHAQTLQERLALLEHELPMLDDDDEDDMESSFGRFELLRRLGGGTADVYLARLPGQPDQFVVKVLRHAAIHGNAARASLRQEAMAAAQLQHPCIGAVLEVGEIDGTPYLVQPYVPGITLAEWIRGQAARRRRVGIEELELLLTWFADIAQALHAAHAIGLVHRDVKPANILIPWSGRPRLLDFGLCQEIAPADAANAMTAPAGTLPYMAPELLESRELPIGPLADVYSLGIALFECLALRLPFAVDTSAALTRAILRGRMVRSRGIGTRLPRGVWRIVRSATARHAWDRYASAAAMERDLRRLLAGQRVLGSGHTGLARARRWLGAHRIASMLLGCVAVLLVLLGEQATAVVAEKRAVAAELRLLEIPVLVRRAIVDADRLVPGTPQQVPDLQRWLAEQAEPLLAQLPLLRERAGAAVRDPAIAATLQLARGELERFAVGEWSTLAVVRRRLAWAQRAQQLTIDDRAAAWAAVRAEIRVDPIYLGLDLPPQLDLVPLGRDPKSGLFEFYHPRSGRDGAPFVRRIADTDPRVDARGMLERDDGSGLVFVLIPGGEFLMGHQSSDRQQPHFDVDASPYARPERVSLDPYFISKYEMTQGQWQVLTGELPSYQCAGTRMAGGGFYTLQHPVENVSALQCEDVLRRIGMALPTEAQWEYAAAAKQDTRWSFGERADWMVKFANVFDRRLHEYTPGVADWFDGDDGYVATAPTGSKLPNGFGLHDTLGNVAEWCREYFESYAKAPARAGDGFRDSVHDTFGRREHRGGSYASGRYIGTWYRHDDLPDRCVGTIGLRPMRAIVREEAR